MLREADQSVFNRIVLRALQEHGIRINELERAELLRTPQSRVHFEAGLGKSEHILEGAEEVLEQARAADDPYDRLVAVIRLKEILSAAVEEARRGPRVYKHGLVTVREMVENTYAEHLTDEQFLALEEALQVLQQRDLAKENVLAMARRLRQTGLRPIPLLTREQRDKAIASLGL